MIQWRRMELWAIHTQPFQSINHTLKLLIQSLSYLFITQFPIWHSSLLLYLISLNSLFGNSLIPLSPSLFFFLFWILITLRKPRISALFLFSRPSNPRATLSSRFLRRPGRCRVGGGGERRRGRRRGNTQRERERASAEVKENALPPAQSASRKNEREKPSPK